MLTYINQSLAASSMRKEILFAILAGVIFGLIIAFGVWRANVALKPQVNKTVSEESGNTPNTSFSLTIAKPENYQVITSSTVAISGVTGANALVSISAEGEDYVINATDDGSFEKEIELNGGVNEIIINAFDKKGSSSQQKLILVYSSEFAKQISNE